MNRASNLVILMWIFLVGCVLLQIFLSKKESKWFGLILPAITFVFALVPLFNIAVNVGMEKSELFIQFIGGLLIGNIPTIVLLGIYFGCREKKRARSQLEKMNIQDLD